MNRDDVPDEDAQAEAYLQVVDAMQGDPVTIRVLDWGGEKQTFAGNTLDPLEIQVYSQP